RAGTETQDAPARVIALDRALTVEVKSGASYVAAPATTYRVSATIDFPHPVVGRQYASFDVTSEAFERELAGARTFGFLKEAEARRARARAGSVARERRRPGRRGCGVRGTAVPG